jgi:hypothetical protein
MTMRHAIPVLKSALLGACLLAGVSGFPEGPGRTATAAPGQEDYLVFRAFRLTASRNGMEGTLRLLQDARVTGSMRADHWGIDGSAWGESSSLSPPLRKARLELLDGKGSLAASEALEVLADLEERFLDGRGKPLYLLTEDGSTGSGSNNGLVTTLLELGDGALRRMEAAAASGGSRPLRLLVSLRSAWRWDPAGNGKDRDILEVGCPPGGESGQSRIFYTRYRLRGRRWVASQRSRRGLWLNESGDAFPARALFP